MYGMPKCGAIGSCGQNQALRAHVWAKDGPKTARNATGSRLARPNLIRIRPSYTFKNLLRATHARARRRMLDAMPAAAHGAIKACFLVLTTCTRVQTVLLHPYTRTDCTTPSVQLYRWDDPV